MQQSEPDRLIELMLACDFTWQELEQICSQFLGLTAEQAADIMADRSMDRRVADLVAWADRQGLLAPLTAGVLGYGRGKRPIRELILSGDAFMPEPVMSEARFDRFEEKIDRRLTRLEQEVIDIKLALQSRQAPLNWNIVSLSLMVAIIAAVLIYFVARVS